MAGQTIKGEFGKALMPYAMADYWANALKEYSKPLPFVDLWANVPRTPISWRRRFVLWLYLRRWWAFQNWWHCLWCCECGH